MQEVIPDLAVMHLRRGRIEAVHDAAIGIDAHMRLHAEIPVVAQRWFRFFDQFAAGLSYSMGFMSGGGFQVHGPAIIYLRRRQQPMR